MRKFRITNFKLIPVSDPAVTSAIFDIEFSDGSTIRDVNILDDGMVIRLSNVNVPTSLEDQIKGAAMEQAILLTR